MKHTGSLVLAVLLTLSLLGGCGQAGEPDTTTAQTTEATEAPEVFTTVSIDETWSVVHDGTPEAKSLANTVSSAIFKAYGLQLSVAAGAGVEPTGGEIIVGSCRDIVDRTVKKLTGEFDFAMKVEENALVLCATNAQSYKFLAEYLTREVFVADSGATPVLDSHDNIVYGQSALTKYNYVQYMQAEGKPYDLADIFDWKIYQNADTVIPYRIYVPFNYRADKQYPLLVNFHGAGNRGNDNVQHLLFIQNVMNMKDVGADEAIIIYPQCPENQQWVDTDWRLGSYSTDKVPQSNEMNAVVELIGQLQQTYSIDAGRIYACGYSMGGYGTWDVLMRHPDLFCAGVAMCGAADPAKAAALKEVPVWAIHGVKDPTVPVTGSRDMAKALEEAGASDFHYTELPDHEHDVWNYTYFNNEIFTWLFSQKKA